MERVSPSKEQLGALFSHQTKLSDQLMDVTACSMLRVCLAELLGLKIAKMVWVGYCKKVAVTAQSRSDSSQSISIAFGTPHRPARQMNHTHVAQQYLSPTLDQEVLSPCCSLLSAQHLCEKLIIFHKMP